MLGLGLIQKAGQRILGGLNALIKTLTRRATYSENTADSNSVVEAIDTAGILDNATILLTPTAYSDARVHSVKTYTGNELVTNGDFSDGRNDWTNNASATLSTENDKLKVSISGAGSGYGQQNITGLTIGATYKISAEGEIGTSTRLALYTPNAGFNNLYADGAISTFFTATSTTENLRLYVYDDGAYGFWDNVSVIDVSSDFDFDRASSATRINSSGLVQDMQSITDPELVLNGDFEELGDEEITNGSFDTDSSWTLTQATISNGVASFATTDGSFAGVRQSVFTIGKTYLISLDVSDLVGTAEVNTNGGTSIGLDITTNGTKSFYMKAENTDIEIKRKFGVTNVSATIDNVSVKQVDPNDRWDISSPINSSAIIENGVLKMNVVGGELIRAYQAYSFVNGNTYKVSFDLVGTDAKTMEIRDYISSGSVGNLSETISITSTNTTHTFIWTANANTNAIYFKRTTGTGDYNFSIDNVSLKDITFSTEVDLARINYDGSGANGHILLEPTSTNLLTYSQEFDHISGYWNKSNTVIETSVITSPDGNSNTYKLFANLSATSHFTDYDGYTGALVGERYTFSLFVKSAGSRYIQIAASTGFPSVYQNFDLTDGILASGDISSATIEAYPNNWYRISVTETTNATSRRFLIVPALTDMARNVSFTGNAQEDGVYIFGAQLEKLSYPTSYIPTLTGSTVTRAAETLTGSGNSTLINSTEGVLYAEIAANNLSTFKNISISNGTSSNRINLFIYISSVTVSFDVGGNNQAYLSYSLPNVSDFNKIAFSYKLNEFKLFVNGVQRAIDTSGTVPTINTFNVLSFNDSFANNFYGKCKALAVFDRALTDQQLTDLTS